MLISLIILALAAVLLFASDRMAHARLQRPRVDPTEPSLSAMTPRENAGRQGQRGVAESRRVASVPLSLITNAGNDAVMHTASHL